MSNPDSSFVRVEHNQGELARVALATILQEKIGEREADIVHAELAAAARAHAWRLAVDCSRVTFLTSVGLGALVRLVQEAKKEKGRFILYGVTPTILELLRITHLHRVLTIVDTREAALKAAS